MTPWLTLDADFALSHARFRDHVPGEGDHIPGSVVTVVAAGATVHDLAGFFGALRLRYFGPRPLIEDDSQNSGETILLSARVGYQLTQVWSVSAEVFNLLDREDHEIDYYYASRLQSEPAGPDDGGYLDDHFHPVDPINVRAMLDREVLSGAQSAARPEALRSTPVVGGGASGPGQSRRGAWRAGAEPGMWLAPHGCVIPPPSPSPPRFCS